MKFSQNNDPKCRTFSFARKIGIEGFKKIYKNARQRKAKEKVEKRQMP